MSTDECIKKRTAEIPESKTSDSTLNDVADCTKDLVERACELLESVKIDATESVDIPQNAGISELQHREPNKKFESIPNNEESHQPVFAHYESSCPPANVVSDVKEIISEAASSFQPVKVEHYETKLIKFGVNDEKITILTQNENGPCPLISIINALILKGRMKIAGNSISHTYLIHLLGDMLCKCRPANLNPENQMDHEKNVDDTLPHLNSLSSGLDVNVKFDDVKGFEYTRNLIIFDLLGLNLYHGWLCDPELKDLVSILNPLSYNELMDKVLDDNYDATEKYLLKDFLESSSSQLTYYGLSRLTQTLHDGEIAILFRNNHFATILRRRDELFTLCTDSGLAKDDPNVVWETLTVDGDSIFIAHNFKTYRPIACEESFRPESDEQKEQHAAGSIDDHDYALALELQQQEQQAAEMEQRNQRSSQQSRAHDRREPPTPKAKESKCCLM